MNGRILVRFLEFLFNPRLSTRLRIGSRYAFGREKGAFLKIRISTLLFSAASVVPAWILGIFSNSLMRDAMAIEKCRHLSFDLKDALELLAEKAISQASKITEDDLLKLKRIFEQLIVEHAGLVFKNDELDQLLRESCGLLRSRKIHDQNPAHSPNFVIVDIARIWGIEPSRPIESSKLIRIQEFLHKPLACRAWCRIKTMWPLAKPSEGPSQPL